MFPKPGKKRRAGIIHRGQRIICRTKSAIDKRNKELYEREQGICQGYGCELWAPLHDDDGQDAGHAAHIKGRKMGGGFRNDALSNLRWLCPACHNREHIPLRVIPRKESEYAN